MRTLKIELTNTTMEAQNWNFSVNGKQLGEHVADMMEKGKFVGSITVTIKETAPYVETVSEDNENEH